jgi:hypothetical protein
VKFLLLTIQNSCHLYSNIGGYKKKIILFLYYFLDGNLIRVINLKCEQHFETDPFFCYIPDSINKLIKVLSPLILKSTLEFQKEDVRNILNNFFWRLEEKNPAMSVYSTQIWYYRFSYNFNTGKIIWRWNKKLMHLLTANKYIVLSIIWYDTKLCIPFNE